MKSPELQLDCVKFWDKFVEIVNHDGTLKTLFGHIVSQVLPCYDGYPMEVKRVLTRLISDKEPITRDCFSEIAHLPFFSEKQDLRDLALKLSPGSNWDWRAQTHKLSAQVLRESSPSFRRLLLQQLLLLLKTHTLELDSVAEDVRAESTRMIWELSFVERNHENLVLLARCMSFYLGFVRDIRPPEVECIDPSRKKDLILTLINNYLVPVLIDGTPIHSRYDHSAFSIQELLVRFSAMKDCKDPLQFFEPEVRNVIEPLTQSKYFIEAPAKASPLHEPVALTLHYPDDSEWPTAFVTKLFSVQKREGDLDVFCCCLAALPDHPALASFILPYLVNYHVVAENEQFLEAIRIEWNCVSQLLHRPEKREFALTVIRHFFALFDRLSNWDISPGKCKRRANWRVLGIATDLELANAAGQCGLYSRSLLHLEFHIRDAQSMSPDTPLSVRVAQETKVVSDYARRLYDLYQELHDSDVIESLKHRIPDLQADDETVSAREIMSPQRKLELVDDLLRSGLYERAFSEANLLKNSYEDDQRIGNLLARAALRLGKWDAVSQLISDFHFRTVDGSFDISISKALYGLYSHDTALFEQEIVNCRDFLISQFKDASMVSYSRVLPLLARFRVLDEIESESTDWGNWLVETPLTIDDVEEITAIRCAASGTQIHQHFLQLAKLCRKSGLFFRAEMFCTRAKKHCQDNREADVACLFESAKLYFARDKSNQALTLLTCAKDKNTNREIGGKINFVMAKWNDRLRSTESNTLAKSYQSRTNVLKDEDLGKAYLAIATLADHRIVSLIEFLEEIRPESSRPGRHSKSTQFWGTSGTPANITTALVEQIPLAIRYYLLSIEKSPKYGHEVIPRVLVICFDIGRYCTEADITSPLDSLSRNQKENVLSAIRTSMENAGNVPLAIWLNSITQLISRVDQSRQLEVLLYGLIRYSLLGYPQATLWNLMSIRNSQSNAKLFDPIWDFCSHGLDPEQRALLDDARTTLQSITSDLISFADLKGTTALKSGTIRIDSVNPRLREDFRRNKVVLPISKALVLSPESPSFKDPNQYDSHHVRIVEVEPTAYIFVTLQSPKKIKVVDSNGHSHHFLVKQDDDLRKDMRMMEFASFVNLILSNDRRCRERLLHIVTFTVVCLNERCGFIEWVENSTQFRHIVDSVYEERGIHVDQAELKRLLPDDVNAINSQKRLENFMQLLKKYPAVSHLWFLKKFVDLSKWFQARARYTDSTAVWSILGYIVGLGDRHPENVLLMEDNGCVFHVDFNCIFDRAKTLPVPETVPFRLTQNVVDAMGVLREEGSFKSVCKLVMATLRGKRQRLVSVLRPFLYDPLLEWKKETNKAAIEHTAKLTLKEVERRLDGFSEDRTTITSPECTVTTLIAQATNPKNLAMLFRGWQAFI
jgi:serine/threonine-protein kinase ATR